MSTPTPPSYEATGEAISRIASAEPPKGTAAWAIGLALDEHHTAIQSGPDRELERLRLYPDTQNPRLTVTITPNIRLGAPNSLLEAEDFHVGIDAPRAAAARGLYSVVFPYNETEQGVLRATDALATSIGRDGRLLGQRPLHPKKGEYHGLVHMITHASPERPTIYPKLHRFAGWLGTVGRRQQAASTS